MSSIFVERERRARILQLALPIMAGMVSQNVLNLADTAMVGTLGNSALAAVGIGGFAAFALQSLILGIGAGVQAIAARRKGEGRIQETALVLNGALGLVLVIGPLMTLGLYFLIPLLLPILNSDPEVISQGIPYLQLRILVIVFVAANYSFRGYWNAVDLSRVYMSTLIVMHASNIFLNYVFIFGHFGAPALGVAGAGLATACATVLGTVIYVFLGFRFARANGFLSGLPDRGTSKSLVRLSIPAGIQQLFFSLGFVVLYWIIGQVGTAELAASNVLMNVMLVAVLPGFGLGLAGMTLVGQALGKGDVHDAYRWGWDVTKIGVALMTCLGLPMWVAPDLVLGVFIHDQSTIELARLPMRLVGLVQVLEAVSLILMNALQGAGDTKRTMLVSVATQWVFLLPLAFLVGPVLGFGLLGIWALQSVSRAILATVFWVLWKRRDWAQIKL